MRHCTVDFPAGQKLAEEHQAVVASLRELSLQRFPRGLARAARWSIAFSLAAITANVRAVEAEALAIQGEIATVSAAEEADAGTRSAKGGVCPLSDEGDERQAGHPPGRHDNADAGVDGRHVRPSRGT